MHAITGLILMVLPVSLCAQEVTLTSFPMPRHFYARDAQDSAVVAVSGSVTTAGVDSVSVKLYKNGSQVKRLAQKLVYSGSSASFSFAPKIHAELSNYKVELYAATTLITTSDNVLCGDAFMVDGQSNALGSGIYFSSPWLRTFELSDSAFHIPNHTPWNVGRKIIENYGVPFFFVNGAVNATGIGSHQRDTTTGSIYGRIYLSIKHAGLRSGIKAILWFQGEADAYDSAWAASGYTASFKAMYNAWKSDYPNFKHAYMFQIHHGCGNGAGGILRETQRNLPLQNANLTVVATAGNLYHDGGCHYTAQGYAVQGEWLFPLIARDLYNASDTVNIGSPNLQRAYFGNNERTRIVMEFDKPVAQPGDTTLKNYFANGSAFGIADSLKADTASRRLTLYLRQPAENTTLTYTPHLDDPFKGGVYEGPWIYSVRNVGALTFHQVPLPNVDPLDSLTLSSMQAFARDTVVDQYASTRVWVVATYSTGRKDTTVKACGFTCLTPFTAQVSAFGLVKAKNTGTVKIQVNKRGLLDTVSIRVKSTTAILDSIRLSEHSKNVSLLGFTLSATGYYHQGSTRFSANIDTLVTWASGLPSMVSVNRGVVNHVLGHRLAPVPVTATLSGKSDTCGVTSSWLVPRSEITVTASCAPYDGFSTNAVVDSTRKSFVSSLGPPQSITLCFSQPYLVDKLLYLPWQDGRLNGVITNYFIYASLDSAHFDVIAVSGTWEADLSLKSASFPATLAKYVRIEAIDGSNGYVNADEIGIRRADTTAMVTDGTAAILQPSLQFSPNPFNPTLRIHYAVAKAGEVKLAVYSLNGQKIRMLKKGLHQAGSFTVNWNGCDGANRPVSAGIYVIALEGQGSCLQKRVTYLK